MPIAHDILKEMISTAFPDAKITLTDLAGDDDHWSVEIISASFAGLSRVQQHRQVHDALDGKLGGQLHALQIKTKPA